MFDLSLLQNDLLYGYEGVYSNLGLLVSLLTHGLETVGFFSSDV
jgi:hypothetical protein